MSSVDPKTFMKSVKKLGSIRAAGRELGIPKSTAQDLFDRFSETQLRETKVKNSIKYSKPVKGEVKRYILTSAQNGTKVHEGFFRNLEAYAEHLGADILISGYTYNKSLFEDHSKTENKYAECVEQYLTNDRYELGPNVVFCGEMNILPTAVNPLSGFETYTREKWGIFPHAKVQQQSIATMKDSPAKMILTTGTVTLPNYIQKKDGIKAEFHHVFGAALVEVCSDGAFFVRHLLGDKKDGSFFDLTTQVYEGQVFTKGFNVLAITWGDIHLEKLDEECADASFGWNGRINNLLDNLRPKYQFIHDLIDFKNRNHHNIKDSHFLFEQYVNDEESIAETIRNAAKFIDFIERPETQTFVIESNHDLALLRWLKTADYRLDQPNAVFFLEAQLAVYKAIEMGIEDFSIFEHLVEAQSSGTAQFLREDDSFIISRQHGGGIECGMHGHLGANGAKGHARQFSKMGPKANVAHTHSAGIFDGIYTAGVTGSLDMGYNKGLSSWSHTHIVTYENGKRALLTMNKGRFFA